ncbi:hypothetical protein BT96DRAFT_1072046 [Gymnopus androsaceus JB14]|uniref:G-protein coupled receptors family 1 profile domain-containing protein n=1 Tax=Gymnopus androsaceus JB14 TaxID=1447944 RepID=A0A6A4I4T9_9AGAR|nr:hypothetical protein BT96DRAFT_1072046 [Gymnopus androsaceus JB14]
MPMNIVHATHSELVFWLVLNVWPSHFGLPILLATVLFSQKVQRHATFINLVIVFLVVGISSSLLYAISYPHFGPEPSPSLCLLQASLVYGVPGIASVAAFALVFQMFIVIRAAFYEQPYREKDHVVRLWVMIMAPYATWLVWIIATALVGSANPSNVSRDRRVFYCSVQSDALTNCLTIFAAVILFATWVLEVWTIVLFYKRWVSIERGRIGVLTAAELNLPIRIMAFGIYVIVAMSLSLLSIKSPESPAPDLVIASGNPSITGFLLIFICLQDILRALCFWNWKRDSTNNSDTDSQITVVNVRYKEAKSKPLV